jgi:choline dehydrogenase-like flavoprotein
MNIVIGSGPAGIACAHALLEKGKEVLVIDAGHRLEDEQRGLLTRISEDHDAGAVEKLKAIQNNPKLSGAGLHTKLTYGSDFPYRGAEEDLGLTSSGTGLMPSLAVGGLSNVWGAAALPYLQEDIQDWPITAQDLAGHYRKILKITGLSAKKDDLENLFPLHTETLNDLKPSSQTVRLLEGLQGIKKGLKGDGIRYGSSRLMVGPSEHSDAACVYCRQCIYGCPYGCIYNSGDDLMSLLKKNRPGLHYRSNVVVSTVKEEGDKVIVSGTDRLSKLPVTLEGERVFVAAGVIPSTRIVLKSRELYDHPVEVKDSQYFLFPLLSLKGTKEAVDEATYTLSQLFIEIEDKALSPHAIHLQVYSYNDVITKTLEQKFRFLSFLRKPIIGFLQHRIIIVQGFLHSQHSGTTRLNLSRDPATMKERFTAEGMPSAEAKKIVPRILRKIGKHFAKLGLFPIGAAVEFCLPGRGFHSGGTFPMKAKPGPLESDIYGRVGGAARIHVVDASVFPSIPATTITLTAMANAHRIGSGDY